MQCLCYKIQPHEKLTTQRNIQIKHEKQKSLKISKQKIFFLEDIEMKNS